MEAGIACNCSSSFGMSNASTNSSESRNKIQSLAAFCIAKFRAAEKSSHHTKSYTHGVTAEAIFLELSEEPVSTTTISQPRALIRSRHIFKLSHSFFVMMQIDRFGMFCTLRLMIVSLWMGLREVSSITAPLGYFLIHVWRMTGFN